MNASKVLLSALVAFSLLAAAPATAHACGGYGTPTPEERVAAAAESILTEQLDEGEWVWVETVKLSKDGQRATATAEMGSDESTRRIRLRLVRDEGIWKLAVPRRRARGHLG